MRQNNISCVDRYALRFAFVFGSGPLIGWSTDYRFSLTETHGLRGEKQKHSFPAR